MIYYQLYRGSGVKKKNVRYSEDFVIHRLVNRGSTIPGKPLPCPSELPLA